MTQPDTAPAAAGRRPRFAVLGEFSAGKSTLINLLSSGAALRTQVTATQMAPVWLSYGDAAPYRVDLAGEHHPYAPGDAVDVERTAYVRMFAKNTILNLCDLIDTPGNSDPNINPIAWERMIEVADAAVWCTPATQAWRQSERASWREVPKRFQQHSMLLITQADKLDSQTDRDKVLRRVMRDARDDFQATFMVSLVARSDFEGFLRSLIGSAKSLRRTLDAGVAGEGRLGKAELSHDAGAMDALAARPGDDDGSVLPRRVARPVAARSDRPVRKPAPARPARPQSTVPDDSRIAILRRDFRDASAGQAPEPSEDRPAAAVVDMTGHRDDG